MSYLITKEATLLHIPLAIPFILKKDVNNLVKNDTIAKIATSLVIFILYIIGLTNEVYSFRNGIQRTSLGFHHPNALGYMLVSIFANILIMNRKRGNKKIIISTAILFLIIAVMANSRTSILALATMTIMGLSKGKTKNAKARKKLTVFIPTIMMILSMTGTTLYIKSIPPTEKVNEVLSGRLSLQAYYYKHYDISLIGKKINYTGRPLDNAYYQMLYSYGLTGLVMMLTLYSLSIKKAEERNENLIANILIVLSVFALMESNPMRIAITPISLFIFCDQKEANKNRRIV